MKKFIMVSSVFAAILVVLGLVAPNEFLVERKILISRPKEDVFNSIKFIKNHDSWSPWSRRDPNMKKEFSGTDGTVGFVYSWSGNSEVGVGEQEIKNIVEGQRLETEVRFTKPMADTNQSYMTTEAIDEHQTEVTWGMKGKMSFPKNVVCFLMNMQKILEKDFDSGLHSLKMNLEKQ